MDSATHAFLDALPKVELHLHLEGAIPVPALWTLLEKYGGAAEAPTPAHLEQLFRYRDFPHFLRLWTWKNGFLREYEDFTFVAEAVAADLAAQNIVYAEAFFSPGDFEPCGLRVQPLAEAIRRGLDRHADRVTVRLVADLVRDYGPARGSCWVDELAEVRGQGIVGVGIGGSEHRFPPHPYASVFEKARRLGFRTSAHAGEAEGPPSVWGAVDALRVDRLGHATRSVEDAALVELICDRRIPLEMCPLSNVRTGVVRDVAAHPAASLMRQGALVTVNTDDPRMFGTSLAGEYAALMEAHGLGRSDVLVLLENAVEAAWCDAEEKEQLRGRIRAAGATHSFAARRGSGPGLRPQA